MEDVTDVRLWARLLVKFWYGLDGGEVLKIVSITNKFFLRRSCMSRFTKPLKMMSSSKPPSPCFNALRIVLFFIAKNTLIYLHFSIRQCRFFFCRNREIKIAPKLHSYTNLSLIPTPASAGYDFNDQANQPD